MEDPSSIIYAPSKQTRATTEPNDNFDKKIPVRSSKERETAYRNKARIIIDL